MSSEDITKKTGDKPTLTSVRPYFSETDTLDGTPRIVPEPNATLESKLSPEQEQQRYGYYTIKDFCQPVIKEPDPRKRNYTTLWDSPWHKVTMEYVVDKKVFVIIPRKQKKTTQINSTTLETLAAERKSAQDYQVRMNEEDKGKLRALIDTSLSQLRIPGIKDSDAVFLLRNAYLALYVTQGKIEGQDAKYLANLALLRTNEKMKQEWVRLTRSYGFGASTAYARLSLPIIEPLEIERTEIKGMKPVEKKVEEAAVKK